MLLPGSSADFPKLTVSVQYIPAAEDVVVGIVVERYAEVCPGIVSSPP
jgi:hypothetical protein